MGSRRALLVSLENSVLQGGCQEKSRSWEAKHKLLLMPISGGKSCNVGLGGVAAPGVKVRIFKVKGWSS